MYIGLGIDLSMSHGYGYSFFWIQEMGLLGDLFAKICSLFRTAAIKFRNGTIRDVVKIQGSTEYVSAMKAFAKDALRVRAGQLSRLGQLSSL